MIMMKDFNSQKRKMIEEVKTFKDNFIGLDEIRSINNKLKINLPNKNPELNIELDDMSLMNIF